MSGHIFLLSYVIEIINKLKIKIKRGMHRKTSMFESMYNIKRDENQKWEGKNRSLELLPCYRGTLILERLID